MLPAAAGQLGLEGWAEERRGCSGRKKGVRRSSREEERRRHETEGCLGREKGRRLDRKEEGWEYQEKEEKSGRNQAVENEAGQP